MSVFDIESIYLEMLSTMKNNSLGTAEQRFEDSKIELINWLKNILKDNKKSLIKEIREVIGG